MKDIFLIVIHLAVTAAKLLGPGGMRAVIAENVLLKQQLIVLRRPRRRAPNLTVMDRFVFGFGSLFLRPGRIRKVATGLQPSTLLKFHEALVHRKYRRLFTSSHRPKKPGPKGPSDALIRAIVELKSRNPRFGCPRIALIISRTFGVDIDKNVGTARRECLDHVLFWNRHDLERKLSDFQAFYNATRVHASLDGNTPLGVTVGETVKHAELDDVRWVSHCRGLIQLPMAA